MDGNQVRMCTAGNDNSCQIKEKNVELEDNKLPFVIDVPLPIYGPPVCSSNKTVPCINNFNKVNETENGREVITIKEKSEERKDSGNDCEVITIKEESEERGDSGNDCEVILDKGNSKKVDGSEDDCVIVVIKKDTNETNDIKPEQQDEQDHCMQVEEQNKEDCCINGLEQELAKKENLVENDMCNSYNDINQPINKELVVEDMQNTNEDNCIIHESNTVVSPTQDIKGSSLATIALDYASSDSDVASIKSNYNDKQDNQTTVKTNLEMNSYRATNTMSCSSSESDSESDSSSSSDSSVIIESNESDSDDSANKKNAGNNAKARKSKGMKDEFDDLPPIEDLQISVPEVLLDILGEISWMVEQMVVVRPKPGKPTLNLDTVLFIEKGQRALGKIFDVFGQVSEPHYCVRFNSSEHIEKSDVKVGMVVYYCPNSEYTSLVFLHELLKMKGSDAVGDDEPPEFSDDEEERAYYEKLQQQKIHKINNENVPFKRTRVTSPSHSWQSNHPWNRNMPRHRKEGQRGNRGRQSAIRQNASQSNTWSQYSHQNNWQQPHRFVHPAGNEGYGYSQHPFEVQSMEYMNPARDNADSNYQNPQNNYHVAHNMGLPLNSRMPFNPRPRFPPTFSSFATNAASGSLNFRYQRPDLSWQSQMPMEMNSSWVSFPPPPPPPPPPSSGTN